MRMSLWILLGAFALLAALSGCASIYAERNAPPIGRLAAVGEEKIHVFDAGPQAGGEGAPVVLIHGASVNLRDMKIGLGDRLAESHRVFAVDRPGRGYSTRPDDGWRLDVQARLIHDAVTALGAEKPVVVGQSFGGAVALAYALQYPEDMSGLVLLAPVSHEWPGGVAWYNEVSGWPVAGFLLRRLVIPIYGPLAAKRGVSGSFGPGAAPERYYEDSGLPLLFRPRDFKANAADLRNLKPQIIEQSRRYGEIDLPTVIFTGDKDRSVSPDLHSKRLVKAIPGADLIILPDTGHTLHHTESQRIADAIRAMADRQ
jgi:pimeloyl-ACP methyl ester carboxylesterase